MTAIDLPTVGAAIIRACPEVVVRYGGSGLGLTVLVMDVWWRGKVVVTVWPDGELAVARAHGPERRAIVRAVLDEIERQEGHVA